MSQTGSRSHTDPVACRFLATMCLCLAVMTLPAVGSVQAERTLEGSVVMLSAEMPSVGQAIPAGGDINHDTWIREVFRQTFLMTARDEFGLSTRDAVLGEPVDSGDAACFHLSVLPRKKGMIELNLRQGMKSIYEHELRQETENGLQFYHQLLRSAGGLRSSLIDVLVDAGFEHRPLTDGGPDVLPQEIEDLLQQMNHVSQYAAVRRLHQLMRTEGESAAVLGGLVRGYAHLSQLTLSVLDLRHRAFGMRSLLYAGRMAQLENSSPVPHWHSAYAFLWMGYPNGAQRELKTADRKDETSEEPPPWLELVDYAINYQFEHLEALALDTLEEQREAAALQWFLRSRLTSSDAFNFEVGQQAREALPYCNRVISGLFDSAGVSLNHELSVTAAVVQDELIQRYLANVKDLPDGIMDRIDLAEETESGTEEAAGLAARLAQLFSGEAPAEEESPLPRVTKNLAAAGAADAAEPSFHVLAGNLNAWQTQQLFQRALFLRYSLGVDAGDFVQSSMSSLPDEHYRSLFAAIGIPRVVAPEQAAKVVSEISHHELNFSSQAYKFLFYLPRQVTTADGTVDEYLTQAWQGSGFFEDAYRQKVRGCTGLERLPPAQWFSNISEHAPLHFAEQILYDPAGVSDKMAEWEERYPRYPDLQWALGRNQKTFGDIDRAIEHYDNYLQMVEDANGYIGLAEAWYIKDPDSEKWMDVLDMALDCKDYGLTHSKAAQRGASTLMRDDRFEDALPWAELASSSYSHAGLTTLIHCLTGLGEYADAENLVRQVTDRYQGTDWHDWCVSTGEGDLQAAWEARQQLMRARGYDQGPYGLITRAIHSAATGDERSARTSLQTILKNPPDDMAPLDLAWVRLFQVVLADRLGDHAGRDQALREMAENDADDLLSTATAAFAVALQQLVASGDLSTSRLEQLSEQHSAELPNWASMQALFAGHALWTHGNKDAAIKQWKFPARFIGGWNQLLSWHWLREAGVDPIHLEGRYFPEPFLQEQLELPKQDQE